MVAELGWSWTGAGFGFTLLGFLCGITSAMPATLIRRFGVRACLLAGCVVMGLAFLCLARTDGLLLYFVGASLAGLGFTLLDSVPGTYLVSRLFPRPSFAIGLFFTIGGLGGVAGPLLYSQVSGITGDWRGYWLVVGALIVLTGIVAAFCVDGKTDVDSAGGRRSGNFHRALDHARCAADTPILDHRRRLCRLSNSAASPPVRCRWRT